MYDPGDGIAREMACDRVRELGYWIAGHASMLTAELDEMEVARDGILINAEISPGGIESVRVVKNYIAINR